ncbi:MULTISPECIES: hypothetical protein [Streptomyces]|jgi:hypothetical protein|uniref:Uncharacterized protein n=2 Tax=Streptomyces TaxID=1883 RepID=A0AB39SI38_9ACTN|nr:MULTISPECIES: hypothetical protein [unclassified Streptomyces]WSP75614.1 hypothetical protein OG324_41845 [Streptomyces sp. NBC_01236]WTI34995.1 hypothetical protein OIC96_08330 [Streptomyces sp. NBC_00775]WUB31331.1 hypothetical protein OHA51_41400 [Streptomyces sp. NBC_00589]
MYVRIITATEPSGRILYAEEPRGERKPATAPRPWPGLAGVDDDPAEFHIVRGID